MLRKGLSFLMGDGTGDNKQVRVTEVGEGEPADGFGSKMADGRVKLNERPPQLRDEFLPGGVVEADSIREELNPERIHKNRSRKARTADNSKDAELTTDPLEWASAPDEHDFPGVDTGPLFDETFDGSFNDFRR